MEYKGKLYGRIGDKVFDTGYTTEDWDRRSAPNMRGYIEHIIERDMKKSTKLFTLWWYVVSEWAQKSMSLEEICTEFGKSERMIRYYLSDLRREDLLIEDWRIKAKPQVKEYKLKSYERATSSY